MGKIIDIITGPLARYWAIAAMALLTVALAYTGFWVYGASHVTRAVEQWVAERRAQGFTVQYVAGETTGYPLSIRLELGNPILVGSAWDWQGENLVITAKPWRPGNDDRQLWYKAI